MNSTRTDGLPAVTPKDDDWELVSCRCRRRLSIDRGDLISPDMIVTGAL
jgi:hypothetical protein